MELGFNNQMMEEEEEEIPRPHPRHLQVMDKIDAPEEGEGQGEYMYYKDQQDHQDKLEEMVEMVLMLQYNQYHNQG